MPGAPNRPPDLSDGAPRPAEAPGEVRARKIVRRLVPSKVALKLDLWKGPLPPDLFGPYDRAERALDAGDLAAAETALDQLAVRFAEPRWPTLPPPFRELRVEIVSPQPPAWDPEAKLDPAEREARKARRGADRQLALLLGSLDWAKAHAVPVEDLGPEAERLKGALAQGGADDAYWAGIDAAWTALRPRIPPPTPPVTRKPAAPVDEEAAAPGTP